MGPYRLGGLPRGASAGYSAGMYRPSGEGRSEGGGAARRRNARPVAILVSLIAAIAIVSCEGPTTYSGLSEAQTDRLESAAGELTRYWLVPGVEPPGDSVLAEVRAICGEEPAGWSYLYRCITDSATVLEPPAASCEP